MSKLYFAYDAEEGIATFDSPEKARKYAEGIIEGWRQAVEPGGEWFEEVQSVCWGEVKQVAHEVRVKNEDREELGGPEFYADYELREPS